jgi:serine/threonine protein kinase
MTKSNKLFTEYSIIEQIGSGSFGEVYFAEHLSGTYVAVKVEEIKDVKRVYNEYKIYKRLNTECKSTKGIPKIYDYIETEEYYIMTMELLGENLDEIFNRLNKKISFKTIYVIAIQIITLLENLHSVGYIHRDIKPNNFLIGLDKNINQIYIMDFGLSKRYCFKNRHIRFRDNKSLIGTARYASINMHMGFEPSRRDDMESLGYMLIYFAKGILPWQGIYKKKGFNHIEEIGEIKICTSIESLCEGLPKCFSEYLMHCRNLTFKAKPNYKLLKNLFIKEYKQMYPNTPINLDWTD